MPTSSPTFPWAEELRVAPDEAPSWRGASAFVRSVTDTAHRQSLLRQIETLPLASPRAELYRSILLLSSSRTPSSAARATECMRALEDAGPAGSWAYLALLWGLTVDMPDRHSSRMLLEAAQADVRVRKLATAVLSSSDAPVGSGRVGAKASGIRRCAVVVSHMSGANHAATRLGLEHAALLNGLGLEVELFAAQDMHDPNTPMWLGTDIDIRIGGAEIGTWRTDLPSGPFPVHLASTGEPVAQRWLRVVRAVTAFQPDAVLSIGFCSPLQTMLHRFFPTVALSVHTMAPMGSCDVWLQGLDPHLPTGSAWTGGPALLPLWYPYRLPRPMVASTVPTDHPGSALKGWLNGRRMLITIGMRLSREITPEFATAMKARLDRHPDWAWVLVGDPVMAPTLAALGPSPSIIHLGVRSDVPALFSEAAIYVNPPRLGGGFSVIEAMAAGLCVVTHRDSDGGRKLGDSAVDCEDDYWRLLERLMEEEDLRSQHGQRNRQCYDDLFDLAAAGPSLQHALELAVACWPSAPCHS